MQFCLFASFPRLQCIVSTQGAYENDYQPLLIRMVILKMKDIASYETKGRVYTDNFENTLISVFLRPY